MNKFILITLTTIIVAKLFLFITWDSTLMVSQRHDNWHHIYTGLILIMPYIFLKNIFAKIIFYVGLGLFLDEIIHIIHLLNITGPIDYWSNLSYFATSIGFIIAIVMSRKYDDHSI